jgi:hypothetical protein
METKIIISVCILLDILAIYRVYKDDIYLFDKDKKRYILWIIFLPFLGAVITMYKIGYKWIIFGSKGKSINGLFFWTGSDL